MKMTPRAEGLTKKFANSALCKVNLEAIETTMFWFHYVKIAKELNLKTITLKVVKIYWFEIHNKLVLKKFRDKGLNKEEAKNCMVRPKKIKQEWFAFHNKTKICSITKKEKKIIEKGIHEL